MLLRGGRAVQTSWKRWLGLAVLVLLLAGCATEKQAKVEQMLAESYSERSVKAGEVADFNAKLLAGARTTTDPGDYLLGPGDLLQITVFEAKELDTTARVSSRGQITLPLLGQVAVKGLSAREAEVMIETRYRENYLKNPHVSIFIQEHKSQQVTLMGEFRNPGTYDYLAKQRLLDVMAKGGGLTDKAGRTAQIRRTGEGPEPQETILVDLDRLIKKGEGQLNLEINGGDVIFVPEAGSFFVSGAVRRPGAYPITQKTFLMEALAAAGGLEPYADVDNLILIRHLGQGERQVLELDFDEPEAQQMEINDRDVIFARTSAWGKLTHGFSINLGIPGAGVGYRDPER